MGDCSVRRPCWACHMYYATASTYLAVCATFLLQLRWAPAMLPNHSTAQLAASPYAAGAPQMLDAGGAVIVDALTGGRRVSDAACGSMGVTVMKASTAHRRRLGNAMLAAGARRHGMRSCAPLPGYATVCACAANGRRPCM